MNEKTTIRRMIAEEISAFAKDMAAEKVFTCYNVREEDVERLLPMIFMPIGFGGLESYGDERKDIGCVYEYTRLAMSRSINGYPIFPSCHVMHKDDWKEALRIYRDIIAAIDAVAKGAKG